MVKATKKKVVAAPTKAASKQVKQPSNKSSTKSPVPVKSTKVSQSQKVVAAKVAQKVVVAKAAQKVAPKVTPKAAEKVTPKAAPIKATPKSVPKSVAKIAAKKKAAPVKKAKHTKVNLPTLRKVANEGENYLSETEDAFLKRQEERKLWQKRADAILFPRKIKKSKKSKTIAKLPKTTPAKPTPKQTIKSAAAAAPEVKSTTTTKKDSASPKPAKTTKKDSVSAVVSKTHKIEKKEKKPKVVAPKKAAVPKKAPVAVPASPASAVVASPSAGAAADPVSPKVKAPKQKPLRTESNLIESGLATGMIDVVFCIDTTGSMDSYLEETKTTVNSIVSKVKEISKGESVSVRFGVVAYRDHPPQETTYLTKIQDLCTDTEALDFLQSLDCTGGGDGAEAVFDGLMEAAKSTSWRDSKSLPSLRYIFHVTDAPPHGDFYQGYSELWGAGCPCGTDVNKVAHIINIEQIHYRLIKIGTKLTKMAEQFKEKFVNYEECPIDNATGMDIKITDMIIRELVPDMVTE